jgi:thioredoxin reductase
LKTGILSNGENAFHITSLVNNLTNNITILSKGKADFTSEQLAKLDKHNIQIIENEILEIEHESGYIKNVIFNNGSKVKFDAIYAAIPFKQHSDIPITLGCELTEQGYIKVDNFQETNIEGVFACGDNSGMRSIANAVYTGGMTGAIVNKQLTDEQF